MSYASNFEASTGSCGCLLHFAPFSLAAYQLGKMQEQLANLRQGIPAELQTLIKTVEAAVVTYPGWESDWQEVQKYLQEGKFSLAAYQLDKMREQQGNLS